MIILIKIINNMYFFAMRRSYSWVFFVSFFAWTLRPLSGLRSALLTYSSYIRTNTTIFNTSYIHLLNISLIIIIIYKKYYFIFTQAFIIFSITIKSTWAVTCTAFSSSNSWFYTGSTYTSRNTIQTRILTTFLFKKIKKITLLLFKFVVLL